MGEQQVRVTVLVNVCRGKLCDLTAEMIKAKRGGDLTEAVVALVAKC